MEVDSIQHKNNGQSHAEKGYMNKETCYSVICSIVTKLKLSVIPTGSLGLGNAPGHPMYEVTISSSTAYIQVTWNPCVFICKLQDHAHVKRCLMTIK